MLASCNFATTTNDDRLYNDFTPGEKAILEKNLGSLIPFIPNDGYYVLGLTEDIDYNHGVRYVVLGASESDVSKYKELLSQYGELEAITDGGVTTHVNGKDLVFDLVAYLDGNGTFKLEVSVISKTLSQPIDTDKDTGKDNNTNTDTDKDNNTNTDTDKDNNTNTDTDKDNNTNTDTTEVGYYLSCNNSTSLLYFTGSVTDGRFDGSTNKSEAVLVFIEEVTGGYYLYFNVGNTKTYITINDESKGAVLSANKSDASLFEWENDVEVF